MTGSQDVRETQEATSECWMDWSIKISAGLMQSSRPEMRLSWARSRFAGVENVEMSKDHPDDSTQAIYSACAIAERLQVCSDWRLLARGAGVGLTKVGIICTWFGEHIWFLWSWVGSQGRKTGKMADTGQVLTIWNQLLQSIGVSSLITYSLVICIFSLSRKRDKKKRQMNERKRTHFGNKNQHLHFSSVS